MAGSETRQPSRRTAIKPLPPDIGNAVGAVDVRDRSAVGGPAHGASAMRRRERKDLQWLAAIQRHHRKRPSFRCEQ